MAAITALNAGYFSSEAYDPIGDQNLESAMIGWVELTELAGATDAEGHEVAVNSGDIANQYRVFVNTESHQVVFAFKGSDHAENWWSDIADSQASNNSESTNSDASATTSESGVDSTMAFKATIELKDQSLKINNTTLPLAAGMQLSAEIVEGKRTVLQYLLSPVQRVASEAGMER